MAGGAGTGGIGDDDISQARGKHALKMGIGIGVGVLAFVIILVHILHRWGTKRAERQNDDEVVDGAPFARRALPRNVMPSPYATSQRSQLDVGGETANVNRLQPPSSKAVAATVDDDIPPPDYSHFVNNGLRRANSETNAV